MKLRSTRPALAGLATVLAAVAFAPAALAGMPGGGMMTPSPTPTPMATGTPGGMMPSPTAIPTTMPGPATPAPGATAVPGPMMPGPATTTPGTVTPGTMMPTPIPMSGSGEMTPSPLPTPWMPGPLTPAGTPVGMMGGMWSGSGPWGATGMWGMSPGAGWLSRDPAALAAWLQLRTAHHAAMQAWYETYRADITSAAAQQALHDLWTGMWADMQAFSGQYAAGQDWTAPSDTMWGGWMMGSMMGTATWDPAHMWGTGYGAEWMTTHMAAMGSWLSLRDRQLADATAWARKYGTDPSTTAARGALTAMTARHRTQARTFLRRHHVGTMQAAMRYATGGWMGLGGLWGGWGW